MRVDALSKVYQGRTVVNAVDLELQRGRTYFLVGPNGCGKTTTIETAVGLRAGSAGSVEILGSDPRRDSRVLDRVRVTLQGASLHQQVKVREHFEYLAAVYGEARAAVERVADGFGLSDLLDRRYGRLSGGQQRRVQVAGCLFGTSELIILDEPTSGVDLESRLSLWAAVRSHLEGTPATLLATTHDLNEAEDYADEVLVMRSGEIVEQGRPAEIVSRSELVAVLTGPTREVDRLQSERPDTTRRRLSGDAGSVSLGYSCREGMRHDAQWFADREVVVAERSPRLSDAYLLTFPEGRDPT
ncbi:MAG: ABC transporter ATP-binding protein [Nocardioides sp.]|nr:ABC transporter ATP-binding protein [Nocardioides sp.]